MITMRCLSYYYLFYSMLFYVFYFNKVLIIIALKHGVLYYE